MWLQWWGPEWSPGWAGGSLPGAPADRWYTCRLCKEAEMKSQHNQVRTWHHLFRKQQLGHLLNQFTDSSLFMLNMHVFITCLSDGAHLQQQQYASQYVVKSSFFPPCEWCYNVPYSGSAVKHSAAPFTAAQSKWFCQGDWLQRMDRCSE